MKIFKVTKQKESLEFAKKSERVFKAKIAAHVLFITDEIEIDAILRKVDQEGLLISVLLDNLETQDFYLESFQPVTKRG